jgi:dihydroxyacid dehydratase/phosphogluconate dehydratase
VKKLTIGLLFILLGLAASVPTVAHAGTNSAQRMAQKSAKKTAKKNARQRKKDQIQSRKAMESWKKHHHSGF